MIFPPYPSPTANFLYFSQEKEEKKDEFSWQKRKNKQISLRQQKEEGIGKELLLLLS